MNSYQKGLKGEEKAKFFLIKLGYKIIAQRIISQIGEIDILAMKNNDIFLFEVKKRKTIQAALYAINEAQTNRSIETFFIYAQKHNITYQQIYLKALLITNDQIIMQDIII